MRSLRTSLLAALLTGAVAHVAAHDFNIIIGGNQLYFNITDTAAHTVMVTYKGSVVTGLPAETAGEVEIPQSVKHRGTTYTVTAIGPKAFSGAVNLTGVVIPSTVANIGDFAFEGCTNLARVVFPSAQPAMGQGVFFKCNALRDISFGSDWKSIELKAFRWSDSLTTITIPARVEKLMNMKSLRALTNITVDANNSHFSSDRGVLYDKNGNTLYGVPRAYAGAMVIRTGTLCVTPGALIDCPYITSIDLPATVTAFSFRETSRMPDLREIVFRAPQPPVTAYSDGQGIFLLQIADNDVNIVVSKDSKKAYATALTVEPGEYYESMAQGQLPYYVPQSQLPTTKNIKTTKNIDTYESN